MKISYSIFYDSFLIRLRIVFLISLCGITIFSKYIKYHKKKLNYLIAQKIHKEEEEILIAKKQLTKLKAKTRNSSKEYLLINNNQFSSIKLDENNLLNSINFENKITNDLSKLEYQAAIKKIILPKNFFSEVKQNLLNTKKSEKYSLYKEKQFVLLKSILENIIIFPKLKIEQFKLQESSNSSYFNDKNLPLGTLIINITLRENEFQKIFNNIINSKYFFVISSINILNSSPNPPIHHYIYSKDNLLPILGNETITVSLKIDLFDIANSLQHTLEEAVQDNKTSSTYKFLWEHPKEGSPLFTSRHYASKNEALIDPIDYPQILYPPVPNEWLVTNELDYANPNILFEDIDQTGFTNLEKWQGDNPQEEPGKFSSVPNDPSSHPLLWTKLRCSQKDLTSETYSIYFLGIESSKNGNLFQIQPNTALQSKNHYGNIVFEKKIRHLKMGEQIEGLPYKIVNYQKKQIVYKKTSYDCSELVIEHITTKHLITLIKKTSYHPQPTQLTNITLIKLENTLFTPHPIISLKLGDYFSLDYVIPNSKSIDKQNIIESENYHLIDINNKDLILEKNSKFYRIPIKLS